MAKIAIVGDGPGGLSAALFLAKNGHEATVYGTGDTAVHFAHLHNYLGLPDTGGTEFIERARAHAESHGAVLVEARVADIEPLANSLRVVSDAGADEVDYVILSEGKKPELGPSLGLAKTEAGAIEVDRNQRTSLPRVYAIGRSTRPTRSQAIISSGDGAVAALDILAAEAGKDLQDWDTP